MNDDLFITIAVIILFVSFSLIGIFLYCDYALSHQTIGVI